MIKKNIFKNKNYIIIGGTSELGRNICENLDNLGSNLLIIGRNKTKIKNLKKKLQNKNNQYINFDLKDFDRYDLIEKEIKKKNYEGLIFCAGYYNILGLHSIDIEEVKQFFELNVYSLILLIKIFIKNNISSKNRSIVIISSVSSIKTDPYLSLYASSKASQVSLCKSFAMEFAAKKIRINSISPGLIKSKTLIKLKKKILPENYKLLEKKHLLGFGNKQQVSELTLFLLSANSSWITGQNLIIDGGYSL